MRMDEVKEKAKAAKNWVKDHKEAIKCAAIFAGGIVLGGIVEKEYWSIPDGSHIDLSVVRNSTTHEIGIRKNVYSKNGKRIRSNVSSLTSLDTYEEAEGLANALLRAVKAERGE